MNDDMCEDWGEVDDYSASFPRAEDEGGWGIDESMYTTAIDHSNLSAEQIAMAERIAAEIERESRCKKKAVPGMGNSFVQGTPAATYEESRTASFLQQQKATLPPKPPHQQQQQQQPRPPQRPAQHVTAPAQQFQNECKVVAWLQSELKRVLDLIGTHGNPQPAQAKRLLNEYTVSVTTMIPYSPPEVKASVVGLFAKCNWDVLRRGPALGSKPPTGKTLCDLIFELGVYFCGRTSQQGPPAGFVEKKLAEAQARNRANAAAATAASGGGGGGGYKGPAVPNHSAPSKGNRGGKGYPGGGGKGSGKGYQGGGKGKGYQGGKGKGYQGGKGGKGRENNRR